MPDKQEGGGIILFEYEYSTSDQINVSDSIQSFLANKLFSDSINIGDMLSSLANISFQEGISFSESISVTATLAPFADGFNVGEEKILLVEKAFSHQINLNEAVERNVNRSFIPEIVSFSDSLTFIRQFHDAFYSSDIISKQIIKNPMVEQYVVLDQTRRVASKSVVFEACMFSDSIVLKPFFLPTSYPRITKVSETPKLVFVGFEEESHHA